MTEIKVLNGGSYLNGKPIPKYRIIIDSICIELPEDKFKELTEKLGGKIEEDYQKIIEVDNRYKQKIENLKELKEKLLKLLYGENYEDDVWLMTRGPKEIDEDIRDLVEKHGKDLGIG